MGVVTPSVINCSLSDLLSHLIQLLAGETQRLSPSVAVRFITRDLCLPLNANFQVFLGGRGTLT